MEVPHITLISEDTSQLISNEGGGGAGKALTMTMTPSISPTDGQNLHFTIFDRLAMVILKFWPWSKIFYHLTITPGCICQMAKTLWSSYPPPPPLMTLSISSIQHEVLLALEEISETK